MTQYSINNRTELPTEFRILLGDYPREAWPNHPNFAHSIQNWLGAHQMFRQLGAIIVNETESFLNKSIEGRSFSDRLGHFGNQLVQNLHGHHSWEDHHYFPELCAADDRFSKGLEMLENDHVEMNKLLDGLTYSGNRVLKLLHLDEPQAYEEAKGLHDKALGIQKFLARHLTDEEDLVVPILLHHKMRG